MQGARAEMQPERPDFHVGNTASKTEPFRALILEDDRISQALIIQAMLRAVPDALVLTARTLAEARELIEEYEVHFCVLDIQLPDGIGIDFLHDIQIKSPNAGVVIFTARALPEYRDQAQAFGVLHFMEKTGHLGVLGGHARDHWERFRGNQNPEAGTGFSASLTRLSTLDVIQIKCLARSTVILEFVRRNGQHGRIGIKEGEIVHAETDSEKGVDAFNRIISWRDGQISEVAVAALPGQTIQGDWQGLLMNAVHWADENPQQ